MHRRYPVYGLPKCNRRLIAWYSSNNTSVAMAHKLGAFDNGYLKSIVFLPCGVV